MNRTLDIPAEKLTAEQKTVFDQLVAGRGRIATITGEPGSLTAPRSFNMMFQTNVGALTDASSDRKSVV